MSILSDNQIHALANKGMIDPFVPVQVRGGIISYGLSSYGYDIRLAQEFRVFTNLHGAIIDPKKFDDSAFVVQNGDTCLIPPNSFILGRSVEKITVPRDVLVVCVGKSTLARVGLVVNVTPLEPEWSGYITIEVSNTTPCPVRVYANEGIAQLLFFKADDPCEISYADRRGKYQNQAAEIVGARV